MEVDEQGDKISIEHGTVYCELSAEVTMTYIYFYSLAAAGDIVMTDSIYSCMVAGCVEVPNTISVQVATLVPVLSLHRHLKLRLQRAR